MMDAERLEVVDSQRFDASKRRTNRLNLNIQTGLGDDEDTSVTSRSNSPLLTLEGSGASFTFARDSSPDASDSHGSSTPPTSVTSSVTLEDVVDPKSVVQTDVFDKGDFLTTRTIIRPVPRSPLLSGCFSRPSSPVISRPSSPISFITSRPSSPINFSALNCFAAPDAFAEQADQLQAQRARELAGSADVQVHIQQVVSTATEGRWIVRESAIPEGLRRRAMEPSATVSSS
ncbi:hypothetical protein C8R43DRAFT_1133277 [Mycena crocata]|nr:hypothetical protein C8R43DRAFT_1133277 [Mycena crocata]